jgi:hypothetical protein
MSYTIFELKAKLVRMSRNKHWLLKWYWWCTGQGTVIPAAFREMRLHAALQRQMDLIKTGWTAKFFLVSEKRLYSPPECKHEEDSEAWRALLLLGLESDQTRRTGKTLELGNIITKSGENTHQGWNLDLEWMTIERLRLNVCTTNRWVNQRIAS